MTVTRYSLINGLRLAYIRLVCELPALHHFIVVKDGSHIGIRSYFLDGLPHDYHVRRGLLVFLAYIDCVELCLPRYVVYLLPGCLLVGKASGSDNTSAGIDAVDRHPTGIVFFYVIPYHRGHGQHVSSKNVVRLGPCGLTDAVVIHQPLHCLVAVKSVGCQVLVIICSLFYPRTLVGLPLIGIPEQHG